MNIGLAGSKNWFSPISTINGIYIRLLNSYASVLISMNIWGKSTLLFFLLGSYLEIPFAMSSESYTYVNHSQLKFMKPDIEGNNVKVWNIRQNKTIRINLVEMSGELALHKHPDADHSLMVLEGKVRAQIGEKMIEAEKGDFISIPANVPHKYWSLTKTTLLVSMDAPYYDPKKTVSLESNP